jgi:acetyl esterase/lipase
LQAFLSAPPNCKTLESQVRNDKHVPHSTVDQDLWLRLSAGGIVAPGGAAGYVSAGRPDFAASICGPLRRPNGAGRCTPLIILCASDDQAEAGCARLYSAWRDAGRPAELHIYESAGHGFGMTPKALPVERWVERFGNCVGQRRYINPN